MKSKFLDLIIRGLSFVVLIYALFLVMYNIRSKFYELKNLVLMGDNEILKEFLNYLESKFPDLLSIDQYQQQNMASKRKVSNIK